MKVCYTKLNVYLIALTFVCLFSNDINKALAEKIVMLEGCSYFENSVFLLKDNGTVSFWDPDNNSSCCMMLDIFMEIPYSCGTYQIENLYDVKSIAGDSCNLYALKFDGTVWIMGEKSLKEYGTIIPVQIPSLSNVEKIFSFDSNVFVIEKNGSIWAWGDNSYGQLGDGKTESTNIPVEIVSLKNISKIISKHGSSFAIANDGTVFSWGKNDIGQLGIGSNENVLLPQKNPLLTDIIDIFLFSLDSDNINIQAYALQSDGKIWAWGNNEWNNIDGTSVEDKSIPVHIMTQSGFKSLNILRDSIAILRENGNVEIIKPTSSGETSIIPFCSDINEMVSGMLNLFVIKKDGSVHFIPLYDFYRLNFEYSQYYNLPIKAFFNIEDIHQISFSNSHTLALSNDGSLFSWGYNRHGQLGIGTYESKVNPTKNDYLRNVKMVISEVNYSLDLKNDGTVWSWGDFQNKYEHIHLIDSTNSLLPIPTQIQSLENIEKIASGAAHAIALKSDGSLWVWGNNNNEQLSDETTSYLSKPVCLTSISDVKDIAASSNQSLVLKNDGTVYSLGDTGPLLIDGLSHIIAIAAGENHKIALKNDGSVWTWGSNSSGQLGNGSIDSRNSPKQITSLSGIISIAAGSSHSMALDSEGSVWAWGANVKGQLGDGTEFMKLTPIKIQTLKNVQSIFAESNTSAAITTENELWLWGDSNNSQVPDSRAWWVIPDPKINRDFHMYHQYDQTLTVCPFSCNYSGIQNAISAASDGYTILVEKGTYKESIDFLGKNILLKGIHGPEQTIIQGVNSNSPVVVFQGGEKNAILEGFTIKNGNSQEGGGIRIINQSSAWIQRCIISNNEAINGGGVFCNEASIHLENCIIANNNADNDGAGLYFNRADSSIILCVTNQTTI